MTYFATSKWPYRMDKLMFFSTLRKKLSSTAVQIVSVNDLRKELRSACNLNISSLKAHTQEIITILQEIVTSAFLNPPVHEASNQLTLSALLGLTVYKEPNKLTLLTLLKLLVHIVPNQSILLA